MWKRNLMAVYYLYDQKNSTVIFTLNPFASYAPVPWELIVEFVNDDDKKMTLYRLQYTKDPWVCQSITFDKTDRIENAKVKTSQFTFRKDIFNNKMLERQYGNVFINMSLKKKYMTLHRLSLLMNATPTIDFIPNVKMPKLLSKVTSKN
ncbi:uncharacterized protein LOC123271474 [Cotesia glomerata]|uniref:uncharacterized protein LOC123271474 n=1 Tax=Cotesia glomerata TaxID=32391 RepID=UPI001D006989|nr:uncharacterized protein LOC123271474 [Cotesia glomerata]